MSCLLPAEMAERNDGLKSLLNPCRLCPHECGVVRLSGEKGFCRTGNGAVVCAATAHFGEEPEISGTNGSGALFFGACNLRCLYCQNAEISQSPAVRRTKSHSPARIAGAMKDMVRAGCHNVNWVSPSHVVPYAVEGLAAAGDLGVPLVYNTSSYDSMDTLRLLEGLVDVYLADLRYDGDDTASEISGAEGYVAVARNAVLEMARQVGTVNETGPDGTLRKGLIVRLLVLPNDLSGTRESLAFLRDSLGTGLRIALMSQYFPTHRADRDPLLSRSLHLGEYNRVVDLADRMGFCNALVQGLESPDFYRPDFDAGDEPFADAAGFRKKDG